MMIQVLLRRFHGHIITISGVKLKRYSSCFCTSKSGAGKQAVCLQECFCVYVFLGGEGMSIEIKTPIGSDMKSHPYLMEIKLFGRVFVGRTPYSALQAYKQKCDAL